MPGSNTGQNGAKEDPLGLPDLSARVKFTDMNDFKLDLSLEDALVLNEVERRAREQGRVWWNYEANRGPNWFLIDDPQQQPTLTGVHLRAHVAATLNLPRPPGGFSTSSVLKRLIRKGIPPHQRARVWKAVSGAEKKSKSVPEDYYKQMLVEMEGKETDATRQIDHDLHRTFPGHPRVDTPEGLASLRRILCAYSMRDQHVGYCQGMNFVAAYLLLTMRTEEDAFWMLCVLVENVLFDDCFAEDLFGCHVEQRVLKDMLGRKMPKLFAHLEAINFEISLVTTEWFLCVFSRTFPSETTLRVWDVLFNEGAKVLFRVALALFKMNEAELLGARHLGEAVTVLVEATSRLFDPDVLLETAFDRVGSMPMSTIDRQRRKQRPAVEAVLRQREERMAAYLSSSGRGTASSSASGHSRSEPDLAQSNSIQRRADSPSSGGGGQKHSGGGHSSRVGSSGSGPQAPKSGGSGSLVPSSRTVSESDSPPSALNGPSSRSHHARGIGSSSSLRRSLQRTNSCPEDRLEEIGALLHPHEFETS